MSFEAFDDMVKQRYDSQRALDTINIQQRYNELHLMKTSIMNRCVDYAVWTLPGMFPRIGLTENVEYQQNIDAVGARGVNHLANRLVMTLFQPSQPFFRIKIASKEAQALQAAADKGDQDAIFLLKNIDSILAEAEQSAMMKLDYNHYRTEATTAAKHLIITGNALLYHPEDNKSRVHVYGLRDYVLLRDLSGGVIEMITRDNKAFCTFSDTIKEQLIVSKNKHSYTDDTDITIYTRLRLENDGKWHLTQTADTILLDSTGVWTTDELPWIPLTWNLLRGENYGRGLVEDYAATFHALAVLNDAIVKTCALAADMKFGVDPSSIVDIQELNRSQPGSYHMMKKDDVFPLEWTNQIDMSSVVTMVEKLEKQVETVFLLNSSIQRDAERVTAEEIKYMAQELETAFGGIYSRFATDWQLREATLLLKRIKVSIGKDIFPQIITGLDSLSNAGEMSNMNLWIQDLAALQSVPPQIGNVIDPMQYAIYCAVRRGVEYKKILKSQQQLQQEQQQAQQQQAQAQQQDVAAQTAAQAGKQAAQPQGQQ
ncbi:MAG TPA: portal protein [Bacteroidia bacterium]|jgi:hypothetical protein|nr:portal protein [Bacteroidia bacterium]